MSAWGMTGPSGPTGDEVDAALADISLAAYQAAWRVRQRRRTHTPGATGTDPRFPVRGHAWRPGSRKRS